MAKFSKSAQVAQQVAHGVGRNGLRQSPSPVLEAAAAALAGHPDQVSRDLILAELTRRKAALSALMGALR